MESINNRLLSYDSNDGGLKFCFEDDILATHASKCFTNTSLALSTSASDFPTIPLAKPANCVVTKDSAKAELTHVKSNVAEKEHNPNHLADQIFEINYDITMTNSTLVSKLSDLQLENVSLLETIAEMKDHHLRETEDLQNALKKAKRENYEMSQTNSDLCLSSVDYRKQAIQLRNENYHLKNANIGDINLSQNYNKNESQKLIQSLLCVNKDLTSKLKHTTNECEKLKKEGRKNEEKPGSSYQQQLYIKILENEGVTLTDKVEQLETSFRHASRESLLKRLQELKDLQKQLNKDADFIKNAQQLQIENENYLAELADLRKEYNELKEKYIIQQTKGNSDSADIDGQSGDSNNSLSEISTSSEFSNGIFDQAALSTPQTANTERPSRWRRFYRRGSISSWHWGSKSRRTNRPSYSLQSIN